MNCMMTVPFSSPQTMANSCVTIIISENRFLMREAVIFLCFSLAPSLNRMELTLLPFTTDIAAILWNCRISCPLFLSWQESLFRKALTEKVPLLKQTDTPANSTEPVRPCLHGEHSYGELSNHWIITETDKYIWFSQAGKEQYFDLVQDKQECRNLIWSPEKQERIAFLRDCLIRELSERPEGFCRDGKLITGWPYPPYIK